MKIAVITTSRADWNPLGMVAKALRERGEAVAVAIEAENYLAKDAIAADGFTPNIMGLAQAIDDADMALLLGDRWETLTVAAGIATQTRVPIAHLSGGDVTQGSRDDDYRHAITKLSHLHFPTNAHAAGRIISMGEEPHRVHNLGSPSIDRLLSTPLMSRGEVEEVFAEGETPLILANWQPETNGDQSGLVAMLQALATQRGTIIFVSAGNDPGGAEANTMIKSWVDARRNANFFENLSPQAYLSLMKHADLMIGNSSSAYYEAPYFGTPCIDVGIRQQGRGDPNCVMPIRNPTPRNVQASLVWASKRWAPEFPYGNGTAAPKIAETMCALNVDGILRKKFHE